MGSSLKERLERLGPVRAVDRVFSGSPVVLSLRPGPNPAAVEPVSATLALAKRGLTLLRAKRAVEEMMADGRAVLRVPTVESETALAADLSAAGCSAAAMATATVDVRTLRERLGLTQEQFALRFALDLDAVRNWEHKRRVPDQAAQSYLRVIARLPDQASAAQEQRLAETRGDPGGTP